MIKVKLKSLVIPLLVILCALVLRFINLSYSDFQGDEIKAFFQPDAGQSVSAFLLTQRKGPVQFGITYGLKFLTPDFSNRLLLRFPFALAGVFSVLLFYKFVHFHFGRKIAIYSSFFFAVNGFLVAFSRLVQYQSFVIFFMVASLYSFSLIYHGGKARNKYLYLGFILWALSILSHYDGIFIFPFVLFLLLIWVKNTIFHFSFTDFKHLIVAGLLFGILLGVFYIPFVLNVDPGTKNYWLGRLNSDGGKISSSIYLFRVYQPIYVIHIYLGLFALGFIKMFFVHFGKKPIQVIKSLTSFDYLKYSMVFLWFFIPFIFFGTYSQHTGHSHIHLFSTCIYYFGFWYNFNRRQTDNASKKNI